MEGAFAVWEFEEICEILKDKEAIEVFAWVYGVNPGGNVDSRYDPHGELDDKVSYLIIVSYV
jgi:uncharacterized protein YyaL (SSP411 family)